MHLIQERIPSYILGQIQNVLHDIKEDFLSFIFEINRNEKPIWTILKELKDAIPTFIDVQILKILALKYDSIHIKELRRKMPKQSLMNCRQQLNQLISLIEQENLQNEYIKKLVMIINNTNSNGQELYYQRHSKNWRLSVKNKLLALMLLIYQFSLEKQKNIFNIVDLWYKIYPDTPIWQLKDDRFQADNKNKNNINSISSSLEFHSQTNSNQSTREHAKSNKGVFKKFHPKDDLISYELELLEKEFNRNLRISDSSKEEKQKTIKEDKSKQASCIENECSSNQIDNIYEDEESTTQEEDWEEDSIKYCQNQNSQSKAQQIRRRKQRCFLPNFVKQTRNAKQETVSPQKQILDLTCHFERINIESHQNTNTSNPFSNNNNNNIQAINHQIQNQLPLNDTTNLIQIKNNLNQLNLNEDQQVTSSSAIISGLQNMSLSQNENNNPIYYNCLNQQFDNLHLNNNVQPILQSQIQQTLLSSVPILRNPCHQIFEIPLQESADSINYYISSQ